MILIGGLRVHADHVHLVRGDLVAVDDPELSAADAELHLGIRGDAGRPADVAGERHPGIGIDLEARQRERAGGAAAARRSSRRCRRCPRRPRRRSPPAPPPPACRRLPSRRRRRAGARRRCRRCPRPTSIRRCRPLPPVPATAADHRRCRLPRRCPRRRYLRRRPPPLTQPAADDSAAANSARRPAERNRRPVDSPTHDIFPQQ